MPGRIAATVVVMVALITAAAWGQRPSRGPNYSRITDGLYMGGAVDQPPRGTTAVLNLTSRRDPYRAEVHAWESIPDSSPAPSLAWLRDATDWVAEQRGAGRVTYVHCQAGISRSGMVVTAYLMREKGWTRDQALEYVRERRPGANPNPAFMELLSDFERELRAAKKERERSRFSRGRR